MTKKYIQDFKSKLSNGGTLEPEELQDFFSRLEGDLKDKKYGLVWESQTEQVIEQLKTNKVYLEEEQDLKITQDPDNPKSNILIEGDNYEALTYLNEIKQKVDVIYIDPPYNTGNKDFIYNDRFIDKEDGFRHSQWLSFMNKRLRLARELMTDDGVIFISIDEYEFAQLKLLCDQVFGESNFIENFIWIKNATKNNSKTTSTNHEYVLSYAKRISEVMKESTYFRIKKNGFDEVLLYVEKLKSEGLSYQEAEECLRDFYRKNKNYKGISFYNNIDENYQVFGSDNTSAPSGTGDKYEVIHPKTNKPCKNPAGGYRYKHETMLKHIKNNRILFGDTEKNVPRYKRFLTDVKSEVMKSIIENNTDGRKELINLFDGTSPFNNPKPVTLVKSFLRLHPNPNAIVLDFFAGSGTTGHAVLELNQEDGGNRQFILVTNNENNIARDVTYERNKRVIEGYTTPKGKDVPGVPSNLAYYKTKQVSKYDIDFDEFMLQHIIPVIQFTEGVYSRTQHSQHTTQLGENVFIFNQYMVDDDEIDALVDLVKDGDILYIQEGQVDYIKTKLPEGVVYKYLEDVLPTNR